MQLRLTKTNHDYLTGEHVFEYCMCLFGPRCGKQKISTRRTHREKMFQKDSIAPNKSYNDVSRPATCGTNWCFPGRNVYVDWQLLFETTCLPQMRQKMCQLLASFRYQLQGALVPEWRNFCFTPLGKFEKIHSFPTLYHRCITLPRPVFSLYCGLREPDS